MGSREVSRGRMKYRRRNGLLCIHQEDHSEDVKYLCAMIPDDPNCKNKILRELHSVPYSGHLVVQRTLARVRKGFYWKGQRGDVRIFVESGPVCQVSRASLLTLACSLSSCSVWICSLSIGERLRILPAML